VYNSNIPTEVILNAYKKGLFPMAETANSKEVYWLEPKQRGIFFFDQVKIPKKLKKLTKSFPFEISVDSKFEEVINNCSKLTNDRKDTWINKTIKDMYTEMFYKGHAHSVECYLDKKLVGGLYGVSIGAVFFGESMFSFVSNASKIALIHLIERLIVGKYKFIDTQFINSHLKQFGAREISNKAFKDILVKAINERGDFEKFLPKGFVPKTHYPLKKKLIR